MFWNVFAVILVIVAGVLVWAFLKKDSKLAAAIRALFYGAKAKAVDLLDDANNQMQAAEAEIDSQLNKTREGLITIKTAAIAAKRDLDEAEADVKQWKDGVALAIKAGDEERETARASLIRQKEAEALVSELRAQFEKLSDQADTMGDAYKELQRQKRVIGQQKSKIKARTIVAKSQQDINDLLAGVTAGGQLDSVARALELVQQAEDRAAATGEVRTELQEEQDLKAKLANLSNDEDIDAELDRLTQEYASVKPDEPVNP